MSQSVAIGVHRIRLLRVPQLLRGRHTHAPTRLGTGEVAKCHLRSGENDPKMTQIGTI